MKRKKIIPALLPLMLALFFLSVAVRPAGAHASLVQSIPEANARLDRAPVLIELFFSEPVEDGFSSIEVLDTSGERVDNDDAGVDPADPTRMSVTVRSLPDGIYTVSWRTLSSVDSHVTAGVFPLAIGDVDEEALAAAAAASTTVSLSPGESLARWFTYAAAMTLVGGTLFSLAVWQPAVRTTATGRALRLPWRKLSAIALLVLVVSGLFWLSVQGGKATGREFALPWDPALIQVLFTTRFGVLLLVRLLLAVLLVRWLLDEDGRWQRWAGLVAGLLILLTISLGSHAAAEPSPTLPIIADWIHLVVASFWVGGLFFFATGMFATRQLAPEERTRLTAVLIPRFTSLAMVSVAVLVLSGLYASVLHLNSLNDLVDTLYGQTLLIKLLIFLPMAGLGALNFLNTSPNMKRAAAGETNPSLLTRFRRLVTSEAVLGLAVLLTVALLTTLPTAADLEVADSLGGTQQAEDLEIALEIKPGRVGINTFAVTVMKDGRPLDDARAVELRFTPTTSGLPPSDAQLTAEGNGRYSIEGAFFSMPDFPVTAGAFDVIFNGGYDVVLLKLQMAELATATPTATAGPSPTPTATMPYNVDLPLIKYDQ